jgi:hypothetical protein
MLQAEDITVEVRLAKPGGATRAFADVTLELGESGTISMYGFSLIGEPPRVVPPARKGKQQYFDTVLLSGKVKTLVCTLIGMAYKKAVSDAAKEVL